MSSADFVLRGGTVVTASKTFPADISVANGLIIALGENVADQGREEIDATGLHIFPGVIDSHVHFNEPGRTEWEGFATGSRALVAGGGTLFFDMPLNAHPPTIDAEAFDLKLTAAKRSCITDFAFWGGLVPGNVEKLPELAERGVIGFKAFMANSGIDDFQSVDAKTLRDGMKCAAALGKIVAVHAESEEMTSRLTREKIAAGKTSVRDYLESRPVEVELEAIRQAIDIANETGCALHIVHVSSGAGVALVAEAKRKNVNVTCETCPHYLVLTAADVESLGAVAKCAPPLRSGNEQQKLWQQLNAGNISTIGSDHSPAPSSMKTGADFFKIWGGISGVQHTLPLLLSSSSRGDEAQTDQSLLTSAATKYLSLIARLLSFNVAERFRLPRNKGKIAIGCDADLAVVDLRESFDVKSDDLFYRHKQSPYIGRQLRGKVVRTILRGQTIFQNGQIVAKELGQLVKPSNT